MKITKQKLLNLIKEELELDNVLSDELENKVGPIAKKLRDDLKTNAAVVKIVDDAAKNISGGNENVQGLVKAAMLSKIFIED